ncbi:type VII secretion integral membrane protein EccD [Mycobacterium sp. M1]|uniref:Type VII secretion integral membrane protein EccD n=1 Tax=Mycolicibacter acidiphilus TaxID=2835306 RepID=A0ABS5RGT3_9MYCO|nr:type VII secretion integral membrane protein EccD [Mycolicibacter acidiphilus]MBS9532793.1 type VII secretion integral membrane protein EccD [Mycolicibacter acidiphilus]
MSAPVAQSGTAASGEAGGPTQQPTTRVTILTGKRMTDLVLPSSAPMQAYLDETVAVLADLLSDTPADVLSGFDFNAQGTWAFARPGAPPLPITDSLDDSGVVDGSLLTLVPITRTERYRPLVEDVIDAIAVLDESPEFNQHELNRFVWLAIPVVTLMLAITTLLAWSPSGQSMWWSLALGLFGAGLLGGSVLARTRYSNVPLCESLLLAAGPPLIAAIALVVPLPEGATGLGAPQVAGGAVAALLLAAATRGGPRRRAAVATFVIITAIAVIGGAIAYGYDCQFWVPAGAIAFGLIIVTNAAKMTVAVARIALPPIPVPGENVDNDELLDPIAAPDAEAEKSSTWQAIMDSVPESAARLTERSNLTKQLLVGFLAAGTLILSAGSIMVVVQGHFLVHSLLVAALVATLCGFRSRLYADRWCAWALLVATVAIPTGVMVRLCHWFPERAWLILAIYTSLALVALVTIGATEGVKRTSPITKRILELLDGASIAAIIPLLLWIAGLYDAIRNIRF